MIGNITNGGSPGEAARYIAGPARDEHGRDVPGTEGRATLIGSRGFGYDVKTKEDVELAIRIMEQDARNQASQTKPVQNTVVHMTNSWHPGYTPSREEMIQARDHFAQAMGMENARSISWSHNDTPQAHTHTMFGGINPDTGYAFDNKRRNEKVRDAAIEWERARGQVTPARQPQHDEYDRRRAGVEQERDAVQQAAERDDYVRKNGKAAIGLFKAHGQETWPRKAQEYVSTKKEEVTMSIRDWWRKQRGDETVQQWSDRLDRNTNSSPKDIEREAEFLERQDREHQRDEPQAQQRAIEAPRDASMAQILSNPRAEYAIEPSGRVPSPAAQRRASDEHQPHVKVLGYEFGESGRKARGVEGLYKAKDTEEWRKISDINHASHIEGLKNGTRAEPVPPGQARPRDWKPEPTPRGMAPEAARKMTEDRFHPDAGRQESHADGAAGKGRPDRTEATRQISFRDQVAQATRNVKPQEQPIGRDRGLDQ